MAGTCLLVCLITFFLPLFPSFLPFCFFYRPLTLSLNRSQSSFAQSITTAAATTTAQPHVRPGLLRGTVYDIVFLSGRDLYAYSASDHAIRLRTILVYLLYYNMLYDIISFYSTSSFFIPCYLILLYII